MICKPPRYGGALSPGACCASFILHLCFAFCAWNCTRTRSKYSSQMKRISTMSHILLSVRRVLLPWPTGRLAMTRAFAPTPAPLHIGRSRGMSHLFSFSPCQHLLFASDTQPSCSSVTFFRFIKYSDRSIDPALHLSVTVHESLHSCIVSPCCFIPDGLRSYSAQHLSLRTASPGI